MYTAYIDGLTLVSDAKETEFLVEQKRTCYNGVYPYKIFPNKGLERLISQQFGSQIRSCYHRGRM